MIYKTLNDLLEDYEEVGYRLAKRGELIVTHPNMKTGKNENYLSVSVCSQDMSILYSRIVKKK
jgi:hypothetical protein